MPHISRHIPEKKISDKIYTELIAYLTTKGSVRDRRELAFQLLTHTERIMLAKRLAIICMLGEGYSFEDIQETLRVSPSTVGRLWQGMQKDKYRHILRLAKKGLAISIIDLMEKILSLPRPRHAPRWQFLDKIKFRNK